MMFIPTEHQPHPDFSAFYNHDFIKSIAGNAKWSISDKDKRPINMKALIYDGKIYGASMTDDYNPCITLNQLNEVLPDAANNAYYLSALVDGFVVLDIEPKCPPEIRDELLKSNYIYGEYSMSGKGYHLIYPLPDCIKNYPNAQQKIVMKEEHGYYEILLSHWVTFTRNMIEPSAYDNNSFEQLFENMCKAQKKVIRKEIDIDEYKPENILEFDYIARILRQCDYKKTPADFEDDMSRYEYGFLSFIYENLNNILATERITKFGHVFTPNEKAWIVYTLGTEKIPYRDKHDLFRNNLPWLLYLTGEVIAKNKERNKKKKR